jgi:hypothetical protein
VDQVAYPKLLFSGIGCLQFLSLLLDQVCRVLEVSEDVSAGKGGGDENAGESTL